MMTFMEGQTVSSIYFSAFPTAGIGLTHIAPVLFQECSSVISSSEETIRLLFFIGYTCYGLSKAGSRLEWTFN
jgi:hypothetical protein